MSNASVICLQCLKPLLGAMVAMPDGNTVHMACADEYAKAKGFAK